MSIKEGDICHECRKGELRKGEVAQEFEREGVKVSIEGIPAFVCNSCGQAYYPQGVTKHISQAASELFALSQFKHAGSYKAAL